MRAKARGEMAPHLEPRVSARKKLAAPTSRNSHAPCFVAAQTLALLLASCSGIDSSGSGPAESASGFGENGVVRIGYANEAPFAYYDNATGRLTGESVEVTRHILKQVGVSRVEGVITEFASLIPGLKARRFDIIAAGMYINPRRCEQISFSEPISCVDQGFMVEAGNPFDLHSYEDVARHPTARLGVIAGGVELGFARAVGVPDERLSIFPDVPSLIAGLQADRVDAVAATVPTHKDILAKAGDPGLEIAQPFTQPKVDGRTAGLCSALGFRQEDAAFLGKFNRALEAFIGSEQHLGIVRPFGFGEQNMPGEHTTEQLCRPMSP